MKKLVCTLYDEATKVFVVPLVCVASVEQIRRECLEFLKGDSKAPPAVYPEDYVVYCLGEFDDEDGVVTGKTVPERLFRLSDLVVRTS